MRDEADVIAERLGTPISEESGHALASQAVDALETCPACGSTYLGAEVAGTATNWLCIECGRCWHPSRVFGSTALSLVDPFECSGCRRRLQCLTRAMAGRSFPPGPPS